MVDLVILLSLALATTAVMGILLAGFVWVPWLIGLLLGVLLLVLMRLSQTALVTDEGFTTDNNEIPSPPIETPDSPSVPVMHYRGAVYQKLAEPQPLEMPVCGKYRGQTWQK